MQHIKNFFNNLMTSSVIKIFNNKYLLDYIYEFDGTYREKFKKALIFTSYILIKVHNFWYNRYSR